MSESLSLTTVESEESKEEPYRYWRERDLTADELFESTNEVGRSGWFFRLEMTGLFPRRLGPFQNRAEALTAYEAFMDDLVTGPLCELENRFYSGDHVVEGIPRLVRQEPPQG